jgi:acid stress-induced BolA-like protein IbaG/YrbA
MNTPTDQQIDLLNRNLAQWVIMNEDTESLLEVFAFEETAKAKLERIQALGKGKNYRVRSITWKFSTPEVVKAQRVIESWICNQESQPNDQ